MSYIDKIQIAADWTRANLPELEHYSIGVCTIEGFAGLPEVSLYGISAKTLFPGCHCMFVRDPSYTLGHNIVVQCGIVIRSYDICEEADESHEFVIPSEVSADADIKAGVL